MEKKTFCYFCLAECGVVATLDENQRVIKIVPDYGDPVSQGYVCDKSQRLIDHQYHADRLTKPLKRVDGEFVEISWKQALDEIAEKLRPIIDAGQAERILYMGSILLSIDMSVTYELIRKLGVRWITNVFSVEVAYREYVDHLIYGVQGFSDREHSQTHISIGQNPWISQHYSRARSIINGLRSTPGRSLISIDPVDSETARMAAEHLKLRPGTDAWLLSAIVKALIDQNIVDQDYIKNNTVNYDQIQKHFAEVDLNSCLETCGISQEQFQRVVDIIKSSESLSIDCGNGIWHTLYPTATNYMVALIIALTGNFNRRGGMLPRPMFNCNLYFTENTTPFTNQKQACGVISAALTADNLYIDESKNFECVIIDNNNPANRFPNSNYFKQQLEKIPLVIALDSFQTASTQLADYVLPTSTFWERQTILGQFTGKLQPSEPILPQITYDSVEIFEQLLDRLGLRNSKRLQAFKLLYSKDPIKFLEQLLDKVYNQKIPEAYCIVINTVGEKYGQLSYIAGVVWLHSIINSWHNLSTLAERIEFADKSVDQFINGKCLDTEILEFKTQTPVIDLTAGSLLETLSFNQQSLNSSEWRFTLQCGYRQRDSVNELLANTKEPILEIQQEDADDLGIISGEQVKLTTPITEITIECQVVDILQKGLIRIANHAIINQLSSDDNVDYINPQYKMVWANIRKI